MGKEKYDFEVPSDKKWEVVLEDWKIAKDRISVFDSQVIAIRISGIPLVLVIIAVGIVVIDRMNQIIVPILNCNGAALPFIFAALYTIPLFLLDALHYDLLLKAVNHAKQIENSPPFKGLLGITNSLTNERLTLVHSWSLYALYATIFFLCIVLIAVFWNGIPAELAKMIAAKSIEITAGS